MTKKDTHNMQYGTYAYTVEGTIYHWVNNARYIWLLLRFAICVSRKRCRLIMEYRYELLTFIHIMVVCSAPDTVLPPSVPRNHRWCYLATIIISAFATHYQCTHKVSACVCACVVRGCLSLNNPTCAHTPHTLPQGHVFYPNINSMTSMPTTRDQLISRQ